MPTNDERRRVAEALRGATRGQSPIADYPVEILYIAVGLPMRSDVGGALVGELADLIDPGENHFADAGKMVDRAALLALADELDSEGLDGWASGPVGTGRYARRIREALGEVDGHAQG